MKKKIYMIPQIEVINVKIQQPLLDASIPTSEYNGGGVGAREVEFSFDGEY